LPKRSGIDRPEGPSGGITRGNILLHRCFLPALSRHEPDSLPRKTVRAALDFLVQEVTETLLSGESVTLSGFGTFDVRRRADCVGLNPKTGAPCPSRATGSWSFARCADSWRRGRSALPARSQFADKHSLFSPDAFGEQKHRFSPVSRQSLPVSWRKQRFLFPFPFFSILRPFRSRTPRSYRTARVGHSTINKDDRLQAR